MRQLRILLFAPILFFSICPIDSNGQDEIVPLPLDKINRDSLNKIILGKEKQRDYKALGDIYGGIYNYFLYSKFRDSALIYIKKAAENFYKNGDSSRYYFVQLQSADLYNDARNYHLSEYAYKKALNYFQRTKNHLLQGHALGGLSYIYGLQGDTAKLIEYLTLSEEVNILARDTFNAVTNNDTRAQILINKNHLDSAIKIVENNLWLLRHVKKFGNGDHIKIFWTGLQLNLLADCYYRKKKYLLAIKYLKEAEQFNAQTSEKDDQNIFRYRLLINSYIKTSQQDSAIKYAEAFFEQTKKTLFILNPQHISEMIAKYESEKKQKQIDLLQQEARIQELRLSDQKKLNIAIASVLLLLIIIAFIVIRNIRLKKQVAVTLEKHKGEQQKFKALEVERSRISAELHDDIGGELSAIRLLSEMAQMNKTQDAQKQLEKISASSSDLVQKMNEIVWALNVNNDTLQSLISYVHRYAVRCLDDVGIECKFTQPETIPKYEVDGAVRRNIFLMVKEALNNVVKHAHATCVFINIAVNQQLEITINDNGKGIDEENLTANPGNGLLTMQKRAKDLNGTMQINNQKGTTI
nr:hypothetical protein [Chitinophagaceae bacterium]